MHAPELGLLLVKTKHCSLSTRLSFLLSVVVSIVIAQALAWVVWPYCSLARPLDEATDQTEQQAACVDGATSGTYAYYCLKVKYAVAIRIWWRCPQPDSSLLSALTNSHQL
jgi:hypothetical protein